MYKEMGETPLECLVRFRTEHPEYAEAKMSYLGRLDPMAEGLLLVLVYPERSRRVGDMRKKEEYLGLDKTYEFEVLWGFKSDTYDILGLIEGGGVAPQKLEAKMRPLLKKIQNIKTQAYPAYSSRTVSGKSLFMWAREWNDLLGHSMIEEIDVPTRSIKIFSLEHIHTRAVTGRKILSEVERRIALVGGDFRQKAILSRWQNTLVARPNEMFLISKFVADVSSGTYVRGLANEMGKILKSSALAWSIRRTRVGEYKI